MRKGAIAPVTAEPTLAEYKQAALVAARRSRQTVSPFLAAGVAAVSVGFGMFSLSYAASAAVRITMAAVFFAVAALILWWGFAYMPAGIARRAEEEYQTYAALRLPMTFCFEADVLQTSSPVLCAEDSYARIGELIETPQLLVFLRDQGSFFVLPKRCLPEQNKQEVLGLLRIEFARHRSTMRNRFF